MKTCTSCGESKDLAQFNKKGPGRHDCYCKSCRSTYWKSYYSKETNKTRHISQSKGHAKTRYQKIRALLNQLKDKPCSDCGGTFGWWVMQFDHLDPETKAMEVARMVTHGYSERAILDEVAKCELVCANCHADRTHRRLQCEVDSGL